MSVSRGGSDLADPVPDIQDGHIKRSAPKVENQNGLIFFLFKTVGKGCCRGFIDDPKHFQPGNLPGVLGSLTLCIVEICGHRNNRFRDLFPKVLGSILDELSDHLSRHFFRSNQLPANIKADGIAWTAHYFVGDDLGFLVHFAPFSPDKTLGGINRGAGIEDRLAPCNLPDQSLIVFGISDH